MELMTCVPRTVHEIEAVMDEGADLPPQFSGSVWSPCANFNAFEKWCPMAFVDLPAHSQKSLDRSDSWKINFQQNHWSSDWSDKRCLDHTHVLSLLDMNNNYLGLPTDGTLCCQIACLPPPPPLHTHAHTHTQTDKFMKNRSLHSKMFVG